MEQNPFSLSNKTVLVTGASSGIGRAISIRCSEMGANIILTARNQSRLQETLYQMSGKNHIELAADLTDKASMDNLVEQLPDLDGIVHCAGVNHRIVTKLIEPADIEQTISPNLVAPILLQTALLKAKKNKKRSVYCLHCFSCSLCTQCRECFIQRLKRSDDIVCKSIGFRTRASSN